MAKPLDRKSAAVLALALAVGAAGSADAHHAFNMYDNTKYTKMTGTVETFRWANPHTMITFLVMGPDGKPTPWTAECSPTNMMRLNHWTATSLKPGDKVDFVLHPNRSEPTYGLLVSATLMDGTKLTDKD